MHKITLVLILGIIGLMTACQSGSLEEKLLVGKWKGAEWIVETNETYENGDKMPNKKRDVSSIAFEFAANHSYKANYGGQKEAGTYYLNGYKLYTTEKGKAQKNVALQKLTTDTLVMKMNRVGTLETLTLIKTK